jgi:ATP phosphoribosyltransferase regulatory subunit
MTERIPSGTRDVLPDEMRELHALVERLRGVFDAHGYGEVSTPTLEYEATLTRGDLRGATPAYRLFDEQGNVLVLRSDMTVPIARVAASRYAQAEPPLRFCYVAHAYRGVRIHQGQAREFLQAGVELLGAPAPDGTVEVLTVLCEALDASGLDTYRIGLGDAAAYPALLDALGVAPERRHGLLHELVTRDFVGLEREILALGLPTADAELLLRMPQLRGGPEVLAELPPVMADAAVGLRLVLDGLPASARDRIIFDLGLVRSLGYYTGAVFDVYDPALGVPIGGGGRYDELLGRFGRPMPAVGFAIGVERLHMALAGEGEGPLGRRGGAA